MLAQKKESAEAGEVKEEDKAASPAAVAPVAKQESDESDTKTFDAGFFKVHSPVRTSPSLPKSQGMQINCWFIF
jgi:hypothetical protein